MEKHLFNALDNPRAEKLHVLCTSDDQPLYHDNFPKSNPAEWRVELPEHGRGKTSGGGRFNPHSQVEINNIELSLPEEVECCLKRKKMEERVEKLLHKNPVALLYGVNGVGKTQLARQYASNAHDWKQGAGQVYDFTWWVEEAGEPATLKNSLLQLFKKLKNPLALSENLTEASDSDVVKKALKVALEKAPSYLLVLDNAKSYDDIKALLPGSIMSEKQRILITSTSPMRESRDKIRKMVVKEFTKEEAKDYFSYRYFKKKSSASTTSAVFSGGEDGYNVDSEDDLSEDSEYGQTDDSDEEPELVKILRRKNEQEEKERKAAADQKNEEDNRKAATDLAKAVGYMPLALWVAIKFIEEMKITVINYLSFFRKEGLVVLDAGRDERAGSKGVMGTYLHTVLNLPKEHGKLVSLLRRFAYLKANSRVPMIVLLKLCEKEADDFRFLTILRPAIDFMLLVEKSGKKELLSKLFVMPVLVSEALMYQDQHDKVGGNEFKRLDDNELFRERLKPVAEALCQSFPSEVKSDDETILQLRLQPHLLVIQQHLHSLGSRLLQSDRLRKGEVSQMEKEFMKCFADVHKCLVLLNDKAQCLFTTLKGVFPAGAAQSEGAKLAQRAAPEVA